MGLREIFFRLVKAVQPEPGVVFPPGTSLVNISGMVPAGFVSGVEILNDNQTPMGFVVDALRAHANLNKTDAVRAMLEIHATGGKLLPTPTYERALEIAEALRALAGQHGYSFVCRAVRYPGAA